jgi:hypothetical protein
MKPIRGGAREGAGRPKSQDTTPVSIRMNSLQKAIYMKSGGAKWLKNLLNTLDELDKVKNKYK